jgi:hypothetical protein
MFKQTGEETTNTYIMQKFLANSIVILTTGALGLSAFAMPQSAKSEQTRKSCEVAIANANERITTGRSITISSNIVDGTQTYPDHPVKRPQIVQIRLNGKEAESMMRSPVFQKAIASEIINSCGSVGAVIFAIAQTDWASTFGLMPDGSIKKFQCVTPDRERNKLSWGQTVCL